MFLHNAQKLHLRQETLDAVILSHGHYDHGGGMEYVQSWAAEVPVYVQQKAFEKKYTEDPRTKELRYIGLENAAGRNYHVNFHFLQRLDGLPDTPDITAFQVCAIAMPLLFLLFAGLEWLQNYKESARQKAKNKKKKAAAKEEVSSMTKQPFQPRKQKEQKRHCDRAHPEKRKFGRRNVNIIIGILENI